MQYHVLRGLREIVAPNQRITKDQWKEIKKELGCRCIFCGQLGTKKNRGIIPDHLIPVIRFGELVIGNAVPACQKCNDSRRDKDWRLFLRDNFRGDANEQISRIKRYVAHHHYRPSLPEDVLSKKEFRVYKKLLAGWGLMLQRAKRLQEVLKDSGKKKA